MKQTNICRLSGDIITKESCNELAHFCRKSLGGTRHGPTLPWPGWVLVSAKFDEFLGSECGGVCASCRLCIGLYLASGVDPRCLPSNPGYATAGGTACMSSSFPPLNTLEERPLRRSTATHFGTCLFHAEHTGI